MTPASSPVLHIARLVDGRFAMCDEQGERPLFIRARGFQAAAGKWIDKYGERPVKMTSYRGRHRDSEWAMTASGLVLGSKKEDDHGNRDSS